MQKFLGMANYDRIFIPELSSKAKPLYKMIDNENSKTLSWTSEAEEAFKEIKNLWITNLEVTIPDFDKTFDLECDASDVGLGAVLKQEGKSVANCSRLLKGAEKNYTITEREVLACLWAMEKLEFYLIGRKFNLITDHKAIEEIKSKRDFGTPRIQRWLERLSKFDFKVHYREGEKMEQADALSRDISSIPVKNNLLVIDENDLKKKVLEIHRNNLHRKNLETKCKEMGLNVSTNKIAEIIKECVTCAEYDRKNIKSSKYIETERPGEIIGIDILDIDKKYKIVMAIDYFSRKLWAKCLSTKESNKV